MSKRKGFDYSFGIDVGTRTTVISYWYAKQAILAELKHAGAACIDSCFLEEDLSLFGAALAKKMAEEPDSTVAKSAVTSFKVRFWEREDKPKKESRDHLGTWLAIIKALICAEIGEPAFEERSCFCFTYPAQRSEHEQRYRQLIVDAGFPDDDERLSFMDEPTAAAFALTSTDHATIDGRSSAGLEKLGKLGLFVDIGAGTTDLTLAEVGKTALRVLASSSIAEAGNEATACLAALANDKEAFKKLLASNTTRFERTKHKISDYYRNPDDQDSPTTAKLLGITFGAGSLADFAESVRPMWKRARKLDIGEHSLSDVDFVVGVGGGMLHTGYASLLRQEFGDRFHLAMEPQLMVARGAAIHARKRSKPSDEIGARLTIERLVAEDITVEFPADTEQETITILSGGDVIDVDEGKTKGSKKFTLKSNVFEAEGHINLRVGSKKTRLGDVDIKWSLFGESNDHGGKVKWVLDPADGSLEIEVRLDEVDLNGEGKSVLGRETVELKQRGEFRVRK